MRIKSKWREGFAPKGMKENGSVLASIAWRLAEQALMNMQRHDYEISGAQQSFTLMAEILAFLIQVGDRIAYRELAPQERVELVTALAQRIAEILDDNVRGFVGDTPDSDYKQQFIAKVNGRAADYADYAYGDKGPDFGFKRFLALRIMDVMSDKDKTWVIDQIMDVEVPEMISAMEKAMLNLFSGTASAQSKLNTA
ncbi:MAG: hypothetical protein ACYC2R_05250 [Burkholderiales bacterium]